jgi:hypothetical protein
MYIFNCPKLNQSFESAQPILNKISEIKNALSADINQLEKYLQTTGMHESFRYEVVSGEKIIDSDNKLIEEFLIWDSSKKRILFVQNELFFNNYDSHPEVKNLLEKPLIETTFEIRKYISENDHLVKFLDAITDKYNVKNITKS